MSTSSIERAREVMHARRDAMAAERRKTVDQMCKSGLSSPQIAARLNVSPVTVRKDMKALGHPLTRRSPIAHGGRELAAKLAADGASISEIARSVNATRRTIRRMHPEAAYTPEQTNERIRLSQMERKIR